mmetsp:Transcript_17701/g.51457  ORF Transcript_17701/g.51457 Transcript_17701/m.51457 type:complete len:253 (-) Transcript_17701:1618-2376(-)
MARQGARSRRPGRGSRDSRRGQGERLLEGPLRSPERCRQEAAESLCSLGPRSDCATCHRREPEARERRLCRLVDAGVVGHQPHVPGMVCLPSHIPLPPRIRRPPDSRVRELLRADGAHAVDLSTCGRYRRLLRTACAPPLRRHLRQRQVGHGARPGRHPVALSGHGILPRLHLRLAARPLRVRTRREGPHGRCSPGGEAHQPAVRHPRLPGVRPHEKRGCPDSWPRAVYRHHPPYRAPLCVHVERARLRLAT